MSRKYKSKTGKYLHRSGKCINQGMMGLVKTLLRDVLVYVLSHKTVDDGERSDLYVIELINNSSLK